MPLAGILRLSVQVIAPFRGVEAIPPSIRDLFDFGPSLYLSGFSFLIKEMQEMD